MHRKRMSRKWSFAGSLPRAGGSNCSKAIGCRPSQTTGPSRQRRDADGYLAWDLGDKIFVKRFSKQESPNGQMHHQKKRDGRLFVC